MYSLDHPELISEADFYKARNTSKITPVNLQVESRLGDNDFRFLCFYDLYQVGIRPEDDEFFYTTQGLNLLSKSKLGSSYILSGLISADIGGGFTTLSTALNIRTNGDTRFAGEYWSLDRVDECGGFIAPSTNQDILIRIDEMTTAVTP